MNLGTVIQEYKDRIKQLEHERDLYQLIAVDEVQFNRNIPREKAEEMVSLEVFQHLQGGRP